MSIYHAGKRCPQPSFVMPFWLSEYCRSDYDTYKNIFTMLVSAVHNPHMSCTFDCALLFEWLRFDHQDMPYWGALSAIEPPLLMQLQSTSQTWRFCHSTNGFVMHLCTKHYAQAQYRTSMYTTLYTHIIFTHKIFKFTYPVALEFYITLCCDSTVASRSYLTYNLWLITNDFSMTW
jgi:hypothetical protein